MPSLLNYEAIERVRYEELSDKIVQHALEWNLNKKCKCMTINNPTIENFKVCIHIQIDCEKRFGKKIQKSFQNNMNLGKIRFVSELGDFRD